MKITPLTRILKLAIILLSIFLDLALFAQGKKREDSPKENLSTNMDFDSTMIDGKMKAPSGFFLQGRNRQSLSNMVKLRSNFSNKLKDSQAAVKSLVK